MDKGNSDLVLRENQAVTAGPRETPLDYLPAEQKLQRGRELAGILQTLIKESKLTVKIGPSHHVLCEGWQLLTQAVGVTGQDIKVWTDDQGNSRARCEYYIQGELIASGESMVGVNEGEWAGRDQYARESMAQTRAQGRAARMKWGWIMKVAGFSATPAEEMPAEERPPKKRGPGRPPGSKNKPKEAEEPQGLPEDEFETVLELVRTSDTPEGLEIAREACTHAKPHLNYEQVRKLATAYEEAERSLQHQEDPAAPPF